MKKANVFCYWEGDIIDTIEGLSYSKTNFKLGRVSRDTRYEGMKEKLFDKIGISPYRFKLKLTCRLPSVAVNGSIKYIGLDVKDDDSLEAMFEVTDLPGRIFVELYVEVEEIHTPNPNLLDVREVAPYSQSISEGIGIEGVQFLPNINECCSNSDVYSAMPRSASSSSMVPARDSNSYSNLPCSSAMVPPRRPFNSNDHTKQSNFSKPSIKPLARESPLLAVKLFDYEYVSGDDEDGVEDPDYCGEEDEYEEYEQSYEEEMCGDDEDKGENEVCGLRCGNEHEANAANPATTHVLISFFTHVGREEFYDQNSNEGAMYPGLWNPEEEEPFVGLLFENQDVMKKVMKLWSIQHNVHYVTTFSKSKYWDIRCKKYGENSCKWRFRACKRKRHGLWQVTIYDGPHSCAYNRMNDDHSLLDSDLVAEIIRPDIAYDPSRKVKSIIETIHGRFGKTIAYKKAWLGKKKAIASISGDKKKLSGFYPNSCEPRKLMTV